MKRKHLIATLLVLAFGISAYAIYDVSFSVPVVNGTANAGNNPPQGAIIYDTNSSAFYGNTVVPAGGSPNWVALGGTASIAYAQGSYGSSASWQNTTQSTSPTNPTWTGSSHTLTTSGTITLSAATTPSNGAGITFSSASTNSVYLVTAQFGVLTGSFPGYCGYSLTDGTNTFTSPGTSATGTTDGQLVTLTWVYTPGVSGNVTVLLQQSTSNGAYCYIGPNINTGTALVWTVMQLK